jgi:hypothetical protein
MSDVTMRTNESWSFNVLRTDDDTDWPDELGKSYTSVGAKFKPTRVSLSFGRSNGGRVQLGTLNVYGPRINKTGLGAIVDNNYYGDPLLPWTNKIISEALAQITKADNGRMSA